MEGVADLEEGGVADIAFASGLGAAARGASPAGASGQVPEVIGRRDAGSQVPGRFIVAGLYCCYCG